MNWFWSLLKTMKNYGRNTWKKKTLQTRTFRCLPKLNFLFSKNFTSRSTRTQNAFWTQFNNTSCRRWEKSCWNWRTLICRSVWKTPFSTRPWFSCCPRAWTPWPIWASLQKSPSEFRSSSPFLLARAREIRLEIWFYKDVKTGTGFVFRIAIWP